MLSDFFHPSKYNMKYEIVIYLFFSTVCVVQEILMQTSNMRHGQWSV